MIARRCGRVLVTALLGLSRPLAAQDSAAPEDGATRAAIAVRTAQAPTIDGRLDESIWTTAPIISDFVQHEPLEGESSTERTEIRILFDREAIYVGGWMLDRDPAGIVFGEKRRDTNLSASDALVIVLDTYRDRQNAFVFGTTPAAIEYDGQVTKEGQGGLSVSRRQQSGSGGGFNLNWDGSWEVATSSDERGWYCEFRIPFSTLRYGGGGPQLWGMNISRTIRRKNEQAFWAPIGRQHTLYRVSEAGTLTGIEAPVRRTVAITPYALSSAHRDYQLSAETDVTAEFGGDAKIGLTPSMSLDLTYNTDFAQVEVDEQQINLTRFSLFFPEKRPFFLENAGTFSVGTPQAGSELGLDLFFSRRIGIGNDGQPVPILGGGRLTGKAGGVTLGVMNIQTERVLRERIPANNYSVGRVLKELPNRSRLGAIIVSRLNTDSTADYNLTYAVDGRLGVGEALNFDAYVSRTETPGFDGRQHAVGFQGAYQTRDWDLGVQYREVGEDFNPEVGFLPRTEYRLIIGRVQRQIRIPRVRWLRELRPHILVRNWFDFDGFNESRYIHIDNAVSFADGAFLSTGINIIREGLKEPFDITDDIRIPTETYDVVETLWRFGTNPSATLSTDGVVTIGGFYSGHRKSLTNTVTAKVGATWAAALRFSHDDVDLREGSFETTLVGVRVAYSFTPRIFLQSLLQYNDQRDEFSGNVRFGWLDTAGTGLFLVFNTVRQTVRPTGPIDRAFVVKFTRRLSVVR